MSLSSHAGSLPLDQILIDVASAVGLSIEPDQVVEALEAENSIPSNALLAAGAELGLSMTATRRSLSEAAHDLKDRAVLLHIDGKDVRSANLVTAESNGKYLVAALGVKGSEPRWLSRKEVESLAGANPEWILVRPAEAYSFHEAGHEDEGHHSHGPHPWERLKDWLRAEKNDLWIAIIYSIAIGILSLVVPVTIQALVTTITFGTVLQPLVVLTLIVLATLTLVTILQALRYVVIEIIQRRVFVRVSSDIVYRLVRAKSEAFDKEHAPELVNRFFEVVTVQKSAAMLLIDGLSVGMQTILGMILLAVYHPWLLAFDIFLLAAIVIVLFPMGSGAIATSIKESASKYAMAAWIEEVARHTITFKSERGAAYAWERSNALVTRYLDHRGQHFRILLRQIIGSFALQAISSAALLGVGGWLVIQGQLTLGQLIAAELIVALVVSGFTKFGKQLETFYDLMASMDKLGHITDLPLEKQGNEHLKRSRSAAGLKVHDVTFGYSRSSLLESVDVDIPAGSRVGLIGLSGHGKSTLLDLVYGLRPPLNGWLEIDGHDYRDLKIADLRSQIALVRHAEIFHGTIIDNIRLGQANIRSGEVRKALAVVGLLNEVLEMPDGLETKLQTGGRPLSPGQAIRLEFARAIAGRPRVIIIDEALDMIDDAAEREILIRTLFDPAAPWTLIIASDNASVLAMCDRVYRVHNGAVREEFNYTAARG